ncbi:MAG: DNA repair protein RadA [Actinomycetota bacterium]|nr:DNA repair protein RadA [Actinomycetota bacterium]
MGRPRTHARCQECGRVEPRWVGRCPECGAWGSMVQEAAPAPVPAAAQRAVPARPAVPITRIALDAGVRTATGIGELDHVLGGGLVAGSVTLLGGEPGAGKSTLLLQAARCLATGGHTVLYASAEESPGQVRLRAQRLGAVDERLLLAGETDVGALLALVEAHGPDILVVDSIQAVSDQGVAGTTGGVAQVRECAQRIARAAKRRGMATMLVGHVTKDGSLAGPRVLEHLVDVVCEIEGDRHHALRLVRASKNRFGGTGEVGCFEMTGRGLAGVADAGRLFLGELTEGTSGVAVTLTLQGQRPLACELQALVVPTSLAHPRRVASGLDAQRLNLLVAVLERRAGLALRERDVYASSVGGVRLIEPAVDLALCLAIASSRRDRAVPRGVVAVGEVGLAGELRLVARTERRLAEAARLGFHRAIVPNAYDGPAAGLDLTRVSDLTAALAAGLVAGSRPRRRTGGEVATAPGGPPG